MNQLNRIDIGYNFCSIAPLELCNSIRVTLKLAACFFYDGSIMYASGACFGDLVLC